MLNNSVISFYDNFGLIFESTGDKAANCIENWSFLTTPLLTDAASHDNCSEYLRKPYNARNYSLW